MDTMMKCFDELNDIGCELSQNVPDESTVDSINAELQGCQERWDNLVLQMENNSQLVRTFYIYDGIYL